jgi:hypothetical protein
MVCITTPLSFGEVLNHSHKKDFSLDSSFRSIHRTLRMVNRIIADMENYPACDATYFGIYSQSCFSRGGEKGALDPHCAI